MPKVRETATFLGLVTRFHPTSPHWRDGMADQVSNLRVGRDGILARRPGLAAYIPVACPTTQAPEPIIGLWSVHFDGTSGGTAKDLLIAHTGDGDGDNDGKLWYWDLASLTSGSWTAITSGSAALALSDTEPGSALVANDFFYYFDSVKTWGWAPGYASGAAFTPGLAAPSAPTLAVAANTASRVGGGMRSYVQTNADFTQRKAESLPSAAAVVTEADITYDFSKQVTVTAAATTNRIYRSAAASALRGTAGDGGHYNYIGEGTGTPCNYVDLRSDPEVQRDGRLNCRGGRPAACRYGVLHRGRAYYAGFNVDTSTNLVDRRCIEWSSAGRPEEVARKYSVSISSQTIKQLPELTPGTFGEAKTWLPDDAGGIVTGMIGFGNEVLVTTDTMITGLYGTMEPFSQRVLSREVGCASHRTVQFCGDFGIMGCDAWGPWVYDGQSFQAVGQAALALAASESSVNPAEIPNSLAVYVPGLKEYWWLTALPGATARRRAIVWQADRQSFTQYEFNLGTASIGAAANVVLAGAQPVTVLGLSNGYVVKVDESQTLADHSGSAATAAPRARIRWWFGAANPETVKRDVRATVLFQSITAGKTVNMRMWACDTIKAGQEQTLAYQDAQSTDTLYPAATLGPENEGRFVALDLIIPAGCDAPITVIDIGYDV